MVRTLATKFKNFSPKQKLVLTWWNKPKYKNYDAIICDGAVRSGKTVCMSLSFVFWAFSCFNNQFFAICGKTISSIKRNVIFSLIDILTSMGFYCENKLASNYMDIFFKNKKNRFYFFGGRDEKSASSIQGITLAGVMLDEVALMPRSFVEQAIARCSINKSKFWFNCNPEHPFHWFYKDYIKKAKEKNFLYLHFTMTDNPSLSTSVRKRYQTLYTGAFYDRFVKGIWTATCGQVYPMFSLKQHVIKVLPDYFDIYAVSGDYGIINPTSFGLWGRSYGVWYRIKEYYYDSKINGVHKTDEEYYCELKKLTFGLPIQMVVIDPSASSFIECVRRHGEFNVVRAKNDVVSGINLVSEALKSNMILFHESCENIIREFLLYSWNEKEFGDCVKKEYDHAMDDMRYFVTTVINAKENDGFFALSTKRDD